MIARHLRFTLTALAALLLLPAVAQAENGRIAFSRDHELYSVAADGTTLARLTYSETTEHHPDWSPDGTRIAFGSFAEGRQSIHVINADGSDERRLSPAGYESEDAEPTWSPDGTQIAFASTRPYNGSWRIWVMNADGSGLGQVTGGFGSSPAWSPDGTRLAYVDAGGGISVVRVEGGNAQRITQPHGDTTDERPAWSPDGTRIAFARRQTSGDDPQLYLVDANGSNVRQLTTTEGASRFPSWSPDGEWIVFTHLARLSVIRPDGTDMHPLLEPWGNDLTPAWGTSTVVPDASGLGAPTIQIFSPEGQVYPAGYPLGAFYVCDSMTSFVVSCEGDVPVGGFVDTATAGQHTFTVRATDAEGRTATASVSYEVLDFLAPEVSVLAPADGAEYEVGQAVEVDYECKDEPGGSGVEVCDGELQDGQPLDTSTIGTFTAYFWTVDKAGNFGQSQVTYTVSDRTPPAIAVASPAEGAAYVLGESVVATYSCGEDAVSCVASAVDTSTVGAKTFTVTAEDASGNVARETRSYRVVYVFSDFGVPSTHKGGEKLSVKFSLGGDHGLAVVTGSAWLSCTGPGDSTPAAGALSYQAGRYKLQVETSASWAGSCRRLAVTLNDGTTHVAAVGFS